MKSPLTELKDYADSIYEMGFTYDPGQVISKLLTLISKLPSASLPSSSVTGESEAIGMIKWIRENYEPEFGDGRHWEDILDEAETPISDKELYNLYKQSKK